MHKKPSPVDVAVGRNIARCRRAKGLSQNVLAQSLGISFQQVQKYEKGTNRITVGKLVEVAQALNLPIQDLLHGSEEAQENLTPLNAPSPAHIVLAREFGKIENPTIQRALRGLIKAVIRDEPSTADFE